MLSRCAALQVILLGGLLATTTLAQAQNKTVEYFFPEVAGNSYYTPKRWRTAIGGQNFTWCCIQSVIESLAVDNETLVAAENPPITNLDVALLQKAQADDQFPCTARYDPDKPEGAPEINVPYAWFAETCPGWALSSRSNLNGWLQPLSGFLLPAVVFCLSVPRRRKIHVFRGFFVADLAGIKSYIPAFFGAIGAMVIVALDTILWLLICWGLSAPMILSGLYEALLDSRVINFVQEKMKSRNLTLDMRCRLLMLVLIGNLDLALEDDPFSTAPAQERRLSSRNIVIQGTSPSSGRSLSRTRSATFEHDAVQQQPLAKPGTPDLGVPLGLLSSNKESEGDISEIRQRPLSPHADHLGISSCDSTTRADSSSRRSATRMPAARSSALDSDTLIEQSDNLVIQRRDTTHLKASPWRHMEELLYPIRLYDDEDTERHLSPRQYARRNHRYDLCQDRHCTNYNHFVSERPHARTPKIAKQIRKTKTRLRTMVNCQYSFGSMVGAPVVFFLGGFVFALVQSVQEIGNEDIALALAFGQWYMTIPHIAIISGLLLAGNNPNILEGVFATQRQDEQDQVKFLGLHFGLAYPSCYKVAWQWQRGYNKLRWIRTLLKTYGYPSHTIQDRVGQDEQGDNMQDLEDLREKTTLAPLDWFLILFMAAFLLGVPFVLAFLTAFFTPQVGLSCRSFTFTIYACAQFSQVLLWLWAYAGPPGKAKGPDIPKERSAPLKFFWRGGWLDKHGFYDPRNTDHFLDSKQSRSPREIWKQMKSRDFRDIRSVWACLWYFLYIFFGVIAGVAALGGTLMQLLGVYTANICQVSVYDWLDPYRPDVTAMISVNTKAMIDDAQIYWEPCGITAIAFMTFVSFVGWWYQRRMKDLFTTLVSEVDSDKYDRADTRAAKRSSTSQNGMHNGEERHLWGSPAI
ncbi:hypothetical protein N8I77_003320 [Diaporthe amygdali]|uniref:Uncharacterized protein n=1 Tax=Phomopsis amygdali TaxID=1214568 RepID=A0AAD9SJ00_PHOAM|nr:hypothetical protein N8I77_003320 [Diaporthe amygdali]